MFSNPATWMAILNAIAGIGTVLQGSGVLNVVPQNWAVPILGAFTAINAVAHAFAPAAPGPLNTTVAPVKA
jgi:hypothetical protein